MDAVMRRLLALHVIARLAGGVLLVFAATTGAEETRRVAQSNDQSVQTPIDGVFTGEFLNGVPVYRLPPISVIAHRGERAALQADGRRALAKHAKPKSARRSA
jgi:hypothetical protein